MEAIQPQHPTQKLTRISYRDPAGSVFASNDRIVRCLTENSALQFRQVLKIGKVQAWISKGNLIETEMLSLTECEHPRIFFPTYPFEWCPEMLYEAAQMTLSFASEVVIDGYSLKDASARNILFKGSAPVFVDLLSFEKRHPNDATWLPFEQFLKNFIYPLALTKARRSTLRSYFLSSRDGWEPSAVAQAMGMLAYLPRYFALIAIPHLLSRWVTERKRHENRAARFASSGAEARFILKILFRHLRSGLERVKPITKHSSEWSRYNLKNCPYDGNAIQTKEKYVEGLLKQISPTSVLDLGCNDGKFSILAAKAGSKVVSVDSDGDCISSLWKSAFDSKLDILPLCMELNEPSPAMGWNNSEITSFLDRAKERFDITLSLALFHHLTLQSLPVEEIVSFISHTTKRYAVIEYVGPSDSQVKEGLSLRRHSIRYPTREEFLNACQAHFRVVESQPLPPMDREVFLLERKS